MKVLTIYPQYTHSSEFDSRAPSMALFYLAAVLEKGGHQVRILDASLGPVVKTGGVYRYGLSDQALAGRLAAEDFDVVGISCSLNARWRFVARIARQVKDLRPGVPVAVGGLYPTSEWQSCLTACPAVDMILLGEAELPFLQVVDRLQGRAGGGAGLRHGRRGGLSPGWPAGAASQDGI